MALHNDNAYYNDMIAGLDWAAINAIHPAVCPHHQRLTVRHCMMTMTEWERPAKANCPATRSLISAVVCMLILASCGGSGCPLGVVLDNPILHVRDATNASTGASIAQVTLSDIRIHGRLQSGDDMNFLVPGNARNTTVEGNQLRCTLGCSFGVESGDYQFIVSAPGYVSKTVTLTDVRYTGSEGSGCNATPAGGPTISLSLDPAP